MPATPQNLRTGTIAGLGAFFIWGGMPLILWFLRSVDPVEIIAQRIFWSMLLLLGIIALRKEVSTAVSALLDPRVLRSMAMSALLILLNWLIYVWATLNGHLVAGSLGYFLNPLMNVALGVLVYGERLRRAQKLAAVIACVGVAIMAAAALTTLWISVLTGASFALYGLVRKSAPIGALTGLFVETSLLFPLALAYLLFVAATGSIHFGQDSVVSGSLFLLGVATTVPLLLFSLAARILPMSSLGLLQYIAPSVQFVLSITLFGEHLSSRQLGSFLCIWAALAIYTLDALRSARKVGQDRVGTVT
jgi:chloramphenicol-sensitive protein RarD